MNAGFIKNQIANTKKIHIILAFAFAFSVVISPLVANKVFAAAMTQTLVRFDRMKVSTATTGTVCAKPATVATETTMRVTFPTGYTLGAYTTFTVGTTDLAWPSGATPWLGITAPASAGDITGQVVTFASGDLTPGTLYCFNWTNSAAVTIQSGAGTSLAGAVATYSSGPTLVDSGSYSTAAIANDQIVVTATVPQVFSFALSGNTDALGTLSTGSVTPSSSPVVATVNTNAKNGWQVWAKSAYQGLCSPSLNTCTAGTPTTNLPTTAVGGAARVLTAGTADYNTGVTTTQTGGTGTVSVNSIFDGAVTYRGGGLSASALQSLASSNGTADNAALTIKNNVAISAITPAAADYTDTITIVGAGLF
jgi:hypothetical protein